MEEDLPAARRLIQNQTDDWRDMNVEKESPEERELFERMENTVQFMSVSIDDYLHLMEELSVARILIRELGDRLSKLEKPWVGLTDEEIEEVERWVEFKEEGSGRIPMGKLVVYISEKLKEKNT